MKYKSQQTYEKKKTKDEKKMIKTSSTEKMT